MTIDEIEHVHWPAVGTAALGMFLFGAVWYTALFGTLWQRLNGLTPERAAELQRRTSPALFFGGMLLCYAAIATVLGYLVAVLNVNGPGAGASVAAVLWLAIAAAAMTGQLPSERRLGVYAIEMGFLLVALPAAGALLGAWR